MVTIVVPEIVFVVLPVWLSNLAAPVPVLPIDKEIVADGFTVTVTVAVFPCRIGFCEKRPIVLPERIERDLIVQRAHGGAGAELLSIEKEEKSQRFFAGS